jgi:hypothetical protein
MKRHFLFAIIILSGLSSCTPGLNAQDRTLLIEARNMARQAASQSSMALSEARAARDSAEKAAENTAPPEQKGK